MNRSIILHLLAALLLVSCGYQGKSSSPSSQDGGKDNLPAHVRLISTTPVKDQGESELSWAYAMLATIDVLTIICFIFPIGLFSKANCMVTYS